jgi:AAA+ superfamily predicted ATPase
LAIFSFAILYSSAFSASDLPLIKESTILFAYSMTSSFAFKTLSCVASRSIASLKSLIISVRKDADPFLTDMINDLREAIDLEATHDRVLKAKLEVIE